MIIEYALSQVSYMGIDDLEFTFCEDFVTGISFTLNTLISMTKSSLSKVYEKSIDVKSQVSLASFKVTALEWGFPGTENS